MFARSGVVVVVVSLGLTAAPRVRRRVRGGSEVVGRVPVPLGLDDGDVDVDVEPVGALVGTSDVAESVADGIDARVALVPRGPARRLDVRDVAN